MPLVNAKCTNCGANLKVDNTKEAAICEHCGSAYIVEKEINTYNITNNNVIHAEIVNIVEIDTPHIPNKSVETLINEDIQTITSAKYNRLLPPSSLIQMIDHIQNSPQNTHTTLLEQKIKSYCLNLDFKFDFSHSNIFLPKYNDLKHVWNDPGNDRLDGYHFIDWLEYETDKLIEKYEILKQIQKRITSYYIELIKTGYTSADWSEGFGCKLWGVKMNNNGEFVNVENKVNNKYLVPYFLEGLENAKRVNEYNPPHGTYVYCLGMYSIRADKYSDFGGYSENYKGEYLRYENRLTNGLCKYCGGEFRGVFKKVCSKCGKPKDY